MGVKKRKLKVVERSSGNWKFPVAYRVEDESGRSLAVFEGLFGWGWSASREDALQNARVSESDIEK